MAALARGGNESDEIDLDEHATWQPRDLHGGTGRPRVAHDAPVHLVHLWKVAHVHEVDSGFHDVLPGRASRAENRREVTEHLLRLRHDVASDDLSRAGVERDLAGGVEQSVGDDAL